MLVDNAHIRIYFFLGKMKQILVTMTKIHTNLELNEWLMLWQKAIYYIFGEI